MKIFKYWLKVFLKEAKIISIVKIVIEEINKKIINIENIDNEEPENNVAEDSPLTTFNRQNLNLDLFRVEAKYRIDERHFFFGSSSSLPYIEIKPHEDYPHTIITIETKYETLTQKLDYSHLALAKLVAEYEFDEILDIGSANGTAARVFQVLGKQVSTLEILSGFESDYSGDYLDVQFPKQFDAIWCSHVLEHQRNVGMFLEKIFSDLKEGGVLAITVPSALSPLLIGHPNIYTPLHLVYNLILAGFDCRDARIKCYDWQISILVKKKANHIPSLSFAATHNPPGDGSPDGDGYVPKLLEFFPVNIGKEGAIWGEIDSVNWD